ncbi:MAG: hypothetical protein O7H39_13055 [Gammaproteobacteria bacterium]|nr:hypothetical protein [Gammaproteobacteria bacterium]
MINAAINAITFAIQTLSEPVAPVGSRAIRRAIEPAISAVTRTIHTSIHAIAMAIGTTLDTIAGAVSAVVRPIAGGAGQVGEGRGGNEKHAGR